MHVPVEVEVYAMAIQEGSLPELVAFIIKLIRYFDRTYLEKNWKTAEADHNKEMREKLRGCLLTLFDNVDKDATCMCTVPDLAYAIEEILGEMPLAKEFVPVLEDFPDMIVEKRDYKKLVQSWVEGWPYGDRVATAAEEILAGIQAKMDADLAKISKSISRRNSIEQ